MCVTSETFSFLLLSQLTCRFWCWRDALQVQHEFEINASKNDREGDDPEIEAEDSSAYETKDEDGYEQEEEEEDKNDQE